MEWTKLYLTENITHIVEKEHFCQCYFFYPQRIEVYNCSLIPDEYFWMECGFIMIRKSVWVNPEFVDTVTHLSDRSILLKNDMRLKASRRNWYLVKQLFE